MENARFIYKYTQCSFCHIEKTKVTGITSRHLRRGQYPRIPVTPAFRPSSPCIVPNLEGGCLCRFCAPGARRGDGCLPVIRCLAGARPAPKPWCDIDFAAFYLFARAAGPLGKKDGATKSGRPHGFAPSLIMLRNHPTPHALRYIHCFARGRIARERRRFVMPLISGRAAYN